MSAKRDFLDCLAAIFQLIKQRGGTHHNITSVMAGCEKVHWGVGGVNLRGYPTVPTAGSEKPRGNHSSSRSLNNGIEGHLGADRPPSSQQLNASPITLYHVSESLTNPILLLLLPGLTVDTAGRLRRWKGPARSVF